MALEPRFADLRGDCLEMPSPLGRLATRLRGGDPVGQSCAGSTA